MASSPAWHPAIGLLDGASGAPASSSSPAWHPAFSLLDGASAAAVVAPTVTTTTLADGDVGAAYSVTIAATGSIPITWSVVSGALPSWASLSSGTGVIAGTPDAPGLASFTARATNSAGSDDQSLTLATQNEASGGGEIVYENNATIEAPALEVAISFYAPVIAILNPDDWLAADEAGGIWAPAGSISSPWTVQ